MKKEYREFAQKEQLPLFLQPKWLDIVCRGNEQWDVILYKKGGEIWGSFVYVIKKKYGFTFITMPKLTQFLGPYIKYPKGQKYYKKLSWEKEIMGYFINNLPNFDYFNINFHYSIMNWLPFYWKEFSQTTRYTYQIKRDVKSLINLFETDIRRRIKKATNNGVVVYESQDVEKLYQLNKMTFERKKEIIPYDLNMLQSLYEQLSSHNLCKIFFAQYRDRIIAANLLVFDTRTVYYLIGGIDPELKDLGGMDVILYESIHFARNTQKDFDFEGSMIESIERYFRQFGAVQIPYFRVSKINSSFLKFALCFRGFYA